MKKSTGIIDGMVISLNIPETLEEYRSGIRKSTGATLQENEGYLFRFGKNTNIMMENSGVNCDVTLLYFLSLKKYGVVEEVQQMDNLSDKVVSSVGFYSVVLELRKDFCKRNNIRKGSIITIQGR